MVDSTALNPGALCISFDISSSAGVEKLGWAHARHLMHSTRLLRPVPCLMFTAELSMLAIYGLMCHFPPDVCVCTSVYTTICTGGELCVCARLLCMCVVYWVLLVPRRYSCVCASVCVGCIHTHLWMCVCILCMCLGGGRYYRRGKKLKRTVLRLDR